MIRSTSSSRAVTKSTGVQSPASREPSAQLDAVEVGQPDVEDDQHRPEASYGVQAGGPAALDVHAVPGLGEVAALQLGDGRLVLHDEHESQAVVHERDASGRRTARIRSIGRRLPNPNNEPRATVEGHEERVRRPRWRRWRSSPAARARPTPGRSGPRHRPGHRPRPRPQRPPRRRRRPPRRTPSPTPRARACARHERAAARGPAVHPGAGPRGSARGAVRRHAGRRARHRHPGRRVRRQPARQRRPGRPRGHRQLPGHRPPLVVDGAVPLPPVGARSAPASSSRPPPTGWSTRSSARSGRRSARPRRCAPSRPPYPAAPAASRPAR